MEKFILFATSYNLGTCWIGGTLKRSQFAAVMNATENELVPAVTPIGFPSDKRNVIDILFKIGASSKKRNQWHELFFQENGEPIFSKDVCKFANSLEMIRLAPSASNKQPWRIVKDKIENIFHFFIFRKHKFNPLLHFPDFSRIDLGIAVCHFDLTIQESGFIGKWKTENPEFRYPSNFEYLISWYEV